MKELERSLGLVSVVAISISSMVGSGLFVLPGLAAAQTGSAVWMAYAMAALCVAPAAACKAELATAMPTSGGTYVYLDRIFGPLVGTVAGLALWLATLMKSSFALVGLGTYLVVLGDVPPRVAALVALAGIVTLNLFGVRQVSRAQVAVVLATLVGMTMLIVFAVARAESLVFAPPLSSGISGLVAATGLVFVSYDGVTKIAAIAEEVRQPGRNIPRGIFVSLAVVAAVYVATALVLTANLSIAKLSGDYKPIHSLAFSVGGEVAGYAVAVLAVFVMISMANTGLLAASRFPFAMSRDQLLPVLVSRLSRRLRTPMVSILMTGSAMGLAIVFLDVPGLAKLASALIITLFVAENAAVVLFRESGVQWYKPAFRAPLYPGLQVFGVLSGLFLLLLLGHAVYLVLVLVAVPGIALFSVYGRRRTERRGVVRGRLRRSELLMEPTRPISVLEGSNINEAAVVVALFGRERSPETLGEVGAALAEGRPLQALHVTEMPEQLVLGAALEEDPRVRSIRRRFGVMAEAKKLNMEFHAIASRDVLHTVHAVTNRLHCDWLVLEWRGQATRTLLPYNPIGWLINHLSCNLALFRDRGIRHFREILVYAEPGPDDALVVGTADDLATLYGASVTLIAFAKVGASESVLEHKQEYLSQLSQMCDRPCQVYIATGSRLSTTITLESAKYDLLVMGTPDVTLLGQLLGAEEHVITRHAACSVLSVKTPRLRTHEAFERRRGADPATFELLQYLEPNAVAAGLEISKKEVLFAHVARCFAEAFPGVESRRISDALWERERTQNTSVGQGVALPHATLAEAPRAKLGIFTSRVKVDYGGPDRQPVDVFFVTVGSPSHRQIHLQLLSSIARLSLQTNLLERLRQARDKDEIVTAVRECSSELNAPATEG